MTRILVTGGTGFIGHHLVRRLMREDVHSIVSVSKSKGHAHHWAKPEEHEVLTWRCDLRNELDVKYLLEQAQPQVIFHLAANPAIKTNEQDPTGITKDNILVTHNLLAHCPEGCRFVFASSATVYGSGANRAHHGCEAHLPSPNSVYGATKVASESLIGAYQQLGKIQGLSLRLVANVGHGQSHGLLRDIVCKLKSDSPTLNLLGDEPGSTKPFLNVQDTVEAFVYFGLNSAYYGVLNVCNSDPVSVAYVAYLTKEATGINKPVRWLGEAANWKGDNREVYVSNQLMNFLGFKLKYPTSAEAIQAALQDMGEQTK